MGFFFAIAAGVASYHWMIEYANIKESVANPTAWALGLFLLVVVEAAEAYSKKKQNKTTNRIVDLKAEVESLKYQLN